MHMQRPVVDAGADALAVQGLLNFIAICAQLIRIQQQRVQMTRVSRVWLFRWRQENRKISERPVVAFPDLAATGEIRFDAP